MPSLAEKVRQQYPGAYNDMSDFALEKAVLAKHPDYQDLATPTPPRSTATIGAAEPGMAVPPQEGNYLKGEALAPMGPVAPARGLGMLAQSAGRLLSRVSGSTPVQATLGAAKGAAMGAPSWAGGGMLRGAARGIRAAQAAMTPAAEETVTLAPQAARQALNRRLVLSPAEAAREAQLAQLAEAQTQLERPAARLAGMRNAGR